MPAIRTPVEPAEQPIRVSTLSAAQVAASALAAVTATVLASYLGIAGTVIGAAVASAATVIANTVYIRSIHRATARMRGALPPIPPSVRRTGGRHTRRLSAAWQRYLVAAAGLFITIALVVTGVEAIAGRSLTNLLHGKPGGGTSFWPGGGGGSPAPTPTPTPIPTSGAPSSGGNRGGVTGVPKTPSTSHPTTPSTTRSGVAPTTTATTPPGSPSTTATVPTSPASSPTTPLDSSPTG